MTVRATCREFVERHCGEFDASHDISHIDRVVANAIKVFKLSDETTRQSVDIEVLIIIASLHDSFDHKYLTTPEAVSAAKTRVVQFLNQDVGLLPETTEMIIAVIDNMGYTTEVGSGPRAFDATTTLYLHIVQDADRLDAIGAVGLARCFAYVGAFGQAIISPTCQDERLQRKELQAGSLQRVVRKGDSGIGICYDKLVFLKDMLKTAAGRAIGQQRHEYLLQFLDQFFEEACDLDDVCEL